MRETRIERSGCDEAKKTEKEAKPYQGEFVTGKLPSFSMGEGWTSAGGWDANESSLMRAPQLWEKLSHQTW